MTLPTIEPILKGYILTRWCCPRDGWFETGEIIGLHAVNCPDCGISSSLVEHIQAYTTRNLPFISKPRKEATPDGGAFQVTHAKGIVDRLGTDKRAQRRGGLKATGRPKRKENN
jgi:hypothetical protein